MEIPSKRSSALDPMRPSQVTQSSGASHCKKGSQRGCSVTQEAQRMRHSKVTAQLAPRQPPHQLSLTAVLGRSWALGSRALSPTDSFPLSHFWMGARAALRDCFLSFCLLTCSNSLSLDLQQQQGPRGTLARAALTQHQFQTLTATCVRIRSEHLLWGGSCSAMPGLPKSTRRAPLWLITPSCAPHPPRVVSWAVFNLLGSCQESSST